MSAFQITQPYSKHFQQAVEYAYQLLESNSKKNYGHFKDFWQQGDPVTATEQGCYFISVHACFDQYAALITPAAVENKKIRDREFKKFHCIGDTSYYLSDKAQQKIIPHTIFNLDDPNQCQIIKTIFDFQQTENYLSKNLPFVYLDSNKQVQVAVLTKTVWCFLPVENEPQRNLYATTGKKLSAQGYLSRPIKFIDTCYEIQEEQLFDVTPKIPHLLKTSLKEIHDGARTRKKIDLTKNGYAVSQKEELDFFKRYYQLADEFAILTVGMSYQHQFRFAIGYGRHYQGDDIVMSQKAVCLFPSAGNVDYQTFFSANYTILNFAKGFLHALKILIQLAICQIAGIKHLDVKEENIVINTQTDEIRLIDFGLSVDASQLQCTKRGTPALMAPEMLQKKCLIESDIYSIAPIIALLLKVDFCEFYHASGSPPRYAGYSVEYIQKIINSGQESHCVPSEYKKRNKLAREVIKQLCGDDNINIRQQLYNGKNITYILNYRPSPIEAVSIVYHNLIEQVDDLNLKKRCQDIYSKFCIFISKYSRFSSEDYQNKATYFLIKMATFCHIWNNELAVLDNKALVQLVNTSLAKEISVFENNLPLHVIKSSQFNEYYLTLTRLQARCQQAAPIIDRLTNNYMPQSIQQHIEQLAKVISSKKKHYR